MNFSSNYNGSATEDWDAFRQHVLQLFQGLSASQQNDSTIADWVQSNLIPLCATNPHNYLMIMTILTNLSQDPQLHSRGHQLKRIAQELEHQLLPAVALHSGNAENAKYLNDSIKYADTDLMESLVGLTKDKSLSSGDVLKVYKGIENGDLDVRHLRTPNIMDSLIRAIFYPHRPATTLDEKLWVLAYAASAPLISSNTTNTATRRENVKSPEVIETHETLKQLDALLQRVTSMIGMEAVIEGLLSCIKLPVASLCFLHYFQTSLLNPDFYEWSRFREETPQAFHLLDEIAILHPLLHPQLVSFYVSLLTTSFTNLSPVMVLEVKHALIPFLVTFVKLGYFPLLARLAEMGEADLETSVLQEMFENILDMVVPPYPTAFAWGMVKLLVALEQRGAELREHPLADKVRTFASKLPSPSPECPFETFTQAEWSEIERIQTTYIRT
ncbi:TH1 protein [Gaertneriomyces semiglobifer]|nr:TH1 protein [Gaertneriomyces semiglobifer]